MRNKLFLEGPIQTGKSTLLRKVLGPHLSLCGGFSSQRLVDPSGATRGFRIGPAADTPLTAPFASYFNDTDQTHDTGIFKYFDSAGCVHTNQSVFDRLGVSYLTETDGYPLMLLDEIGGSELLCPGFCEALDALLTSDIPCLGVLKLADSARPMQKPYHIADGTPSIVDRNLDLRRRILLDYGGEILYYQRPGSEMPGKLHSTSNEYPSAPSQSVHQKLRSFVDEIFCNR